VASARCYDHYFGDVVPILALRKKTGLTVCFEPATLYRVTATRAPQQERSRATQQRLLEATVDCLVEYGWSGASTTVIAERAGVSRGAQLHHYPTRAALVLAAVEHLAERRAAEIRAEATALAVDGDRRLDQVIDMLAAAFTGPLFVAALEVWVAARTDEELRAALVPLEARVGREMHRLAVDLLDADETRPGIREAVQATLDLLRGLGVANLLSDDSHRREQLLAAWKRQLATVIREA
jgi:AcrR family transcriptional regulator